MSLLPDTDRILLGPGPEPDVAARDARDGGADAQPSRSADDARCSTTCARGWRGCSARADGSFAFAVSGTGTSGMETAVANLVSEGTRAHGRRHRLLRRSPRADVRALRRDGHAARRRVGPRVRSRRAARAAEGDAGRRRRDGARRNVHRRPEPGARAGGDRARARRADDRRRGHVARRHAARRRRVGHRRLLQLHAEVPRRAVGAGAGRLRAARARAAREVPQLLLRSRAARGLLAAAQVSPHDVVDAGLRAGRGAGDRRGRRARRALGAARAQPSRAARRRSRRSGSRCCRAKASGCGRSTPCACPTASTRRPCASTCSTSSTSRSAPASVRSPARSGASA